MNAFKEYFAKLRSHMPRLLRPPSQLVSKKPANHPVEEPDYYKTGGFHPISLGDRLDGGQYTILRKLGYGQYSTVWLARDAKYQRYVALKMLRADCYGGPHDIFEREILYKILDVSKRSAHEGRNYVSSLLGHFQHRGPNGKHVCFVFDVLGHHMQFQANKYDGGKIPVKAVKKMTRQILLGLDFLHRECGVIHTDLMPTNILLEPENPDNAVSQYLADNPQRTNINGNTITPLREVIKTPLISEMDKPHIRIIDFGVASWRNKHLSDRIQSPALRAPEVTIGAPWDIGVDIWSLGCLVVEFIQGIVLFSGQASENGAWTAEDDQLARMSEISGPFPPHFIKKGKRAAYFFDNKGNLRRVPNLKPTCLEGLLNGTTEPFIKPHDMPDAELPVFIDFVKGMLTIDPDSRKSASELLQHRWINS